MSENGNGSSRNRVREAFFNQAQDNSIEVPIEGTDVKILVRQPKLEAILGARELQGEVGLAEATARLLVAHCFDPDTQETIFTDEDIPRIMNAPFNATMIALSKAMSNMTDLSLSLETEGNASSENHTGEQSTESASTTEG